MSQTKLGLIWMNFSGEVLGLERGSGVTRFQHVLLILSEESLIKNPYSSSSNIKETGFLFLFFCSGLALLLSQFSFSAGFIRLCLCLCFIAISCVDTLSFDKKFISFKTWNSVPSQTFVFSSQVWLDDSSLGGIWLVLTGLTGRSMREKTEPASDGLASLRNLADLRTLRRVETRSFFFFFPATAEIQGINTCLTITKYILIN